MKNQHTPGPWKLSGCRMSRNGSENPMIECDEAHEPILAELCGQDRPFAEKEANARLIASAPCLLEMLKDVGSWLECGLRRGQIRCGTANRDGDLVTQVRAAIERATRP